MRAEAPRAEADGCRGCRPPGRVRSVFVCALAVSAATAQPCSAQVLRAPELTLSADGSGPEVEAARDLFDKGLELFKRKRYEQALERFREAYLLYRDPRLLLAMGRAAQFVPGQLEASVQYYNAFEDAMERIRRRLLTERDSAEGTPESVAEDLEKVDQHLATVREGLDAVRRELSLALAQVLLDVIPPDAQITFSGVEWPVVMEHQKELWLPPGSYTVKVSATGYRTKTFPLTLRRGVPTTLEARLEPAHEPRTGAIRVRSAVPTSWVRIAGHDATVALTRDYPLAPGRYDVVIGAPGYDEVHKAVQVAPGEVTTIVAILSPPQSATPSEAEVVSAETLTPEPPPPSWTRGDTGWTLLGAGGAFLLAGAVMHGVSVARAVDINAREVSCPGCLDAARADYDSAKRLYAGAIAGYSAGAAAAAAGVVLLVLDSAEPSGPAISAAPLVGGAFVGSTWRF